MGKHLAGKKGKERSGPEFGARGPSPYRVLEEGRPACTRNNHSAHGLSGADEVFIKQEFLRMKTLDFQSIWYSVLLNQRLRCDVFL